MALTKTVLLYFNYLEQNLFMCRISIDLVAYINKQCIVSNNLFSSSKRNKRVKCLKELN